MTGLQAFLDVEYRLQQEAAGEAESDRERRRRAGREWLAARGGSPARARAALRDDPAERRAFAAAWRDALAADGETLLGARRLKAQRLASVVAAGAGLALGLGAGRAACAAPGGAPVNLWLFLGLLVLLPLASLIVLAGARLAARLRGISVPGLFQRFAQGLGRWAFLRQLGGGLPEPGSRLLAVERRLAFQLAQIFAVAFSLGAVLAFVALLLFSGLSFGWSATPAGMKPALLRGLVRVLGTPWAAFLPWAVPSPEAVAASRWAPLERAFPEAGGRSAAELADAWWPFLLVTLLAWSLLPRLLLALLARRRLATFLSRQDWNHRQLLDLYEDMLPAAEGWTVAAAEAPAHAPPAPAPEPPADPDAPDQSVVVWGGWSTDDAAWTAPALADHGLAAAERLHAGGREVAQDERALARLAERGPAQVWLLVEAGEAPDKRVLGFLRALRERLPRVPLRVGLCDWRPGEGWRRVTRRDAEVWRLSLDGLGDARLWSGALGPGAERAA